MPHNKTGRRVLSNGLRFSGWGFVLVAFSILLSHAGYWLDEKLNTAPVFMAGLLFLAVILSIVKMTQEVLKMVERGE